MNQSKNEERGPDPYACWVYKGPEGAGKILRSKEEVAAAYKDGWSDCPTKAKAKAEAEAEAAKAKK